MEEKVQPEVIIGAGLDKQFREYQVYTYENKDATFRGELKNYNYNNILKDKQTHINKLYELANYYVDADSIFSGIVKRVLVPFSLSGGYKLKGSSEATKQKFMEYYEYSSFLDTARAIFYELYLFANCYIYFMPDGRIITLPPHKVRISDIMINGEPVIEFNVAELNKYTAGYKIEGFVDTLKVKYEGYPPEITQQLEAGNLAAWVQLDPANTFVLQESKPLWQKYAVPFVSTCLKPLAKKELISYYEDVQLNVGAKGFLHAKLGHDELLPKPTKAQLDATAKIFQDALNKFPLAVTSHFVDAKFITIDTKGMFDKSKYTDVNSQILSSGGISPLVVVGESNGGSFAEANINVSTAKQRIKQNQNNFCEMMKKYNKKLSELWRVGKNRVPIFEFKEIDLIDDSSIRQEALALWQQGNISRTTLLEEHGYDVEQEYERRVFESGKDFEEVFAPPQNANTMTSNPEDTTSKGRPATPIKDSKQDKNNSKSGAAKKPSQK